MPSNPKGSSSIATQKNLTVDNGVKTGATREKDRNLLERMIRHRSLQLNHLPSVGVKKLALEIGLDPSSSESSTSTSDQGATVLQQKILEEVEYAFQQAADQSRPSTSRRQAWTQLRKLLSKIDDACKGIEIRTSQNQQEGSGHSVTLQELSQSALQSTNLARGSDTASVAVAPAPTRPSSSASIASKRPRSNINRSTDNNRPLNVTRTLLQGAQNTDKLLSGRTTGDSAYRDMNGQAPPNGSTTSTTQQKPTGPAPPYSRRSNLVTSGSVSNGGTQHKSSSGYVDSRPREDDDMDLSDTDDEDLVLPVNKKIRPSISSSSAAAVSSTRVVSADDIKNDIKPAALAVAVVKPSPTADILGKLMKPTTIPPPPVAADIPLAKVQNTLAANLTPMEFPDDHGRDKFTDSCAGHGRFNFQFKIPNPSFAMQESFGERLNTWEPFWKPVETIWTGMTAPVPNAPANPNVKEVFPVTAGYGRFCIDHKLAQRIPSTSWGSSNAPEDGELRIMMFMLPVNLTLKDRKKRADTHQWPRGTHLMLDRTSTHIAQRKQQSHNRAEWKYMSRPLDITGAIRTKPSRSAYHTLHMFSCDPDCYYAGVFLCKYQAPSAVYQALIGQSLSQPPFLQRLSFDGAKMKALQNISQNAIAVLDDNDDNVNAKPSEEPGQLVFSLTCPISKSIIKTPVRGRCCKHWQCFDLENFLASNVAISGSRWRCAVCEIFLSYRDLQYCALTDAAIHQYSNEASPTVRDRVEFNSFGIYKLLPAKEPRYKKKKQNGLSSASTTQNRAVQEVVIDLD